jgi:hypothetical protein
VKQTPTLSVVPIKNDDASFLKLVERIANHTIQQFKPADIFLIRIDHWFDQKWLAYSGNILGVVSVRKSRLTIPPFVPNRVISQDAYSLDELAGSYDHAEALPLHLVQSSRENLTRFIDRVTKSGMFIWFSGGTQQASTGSIMVYAVTDDLQNAWYASFERSTAWQINKVRGLSKNELLHLTDDSLHEQNA